MDICFLDNRLRRDCNDSQRLKARYGADMAKVISRRLDDLRAARTLEDMRHLPGRCHELGSNRAGQLSLDLRGPHRLLFAPAHGPAPTKTDGGLDWTQVTAVEVMGVEDTHG